MRSSNTRVELRAVVVVELVPVGEADAGLLERGRDVLGERRAPARVDELLDAVADRAELLDLVEPVGRRGCARPAASCSCRPDTRTWKNSSRFELKIARNFARSSSGSVGVLGEREHPRVEVEPRELAVEVARVVEGGSIRRRPGAPWPDGNGDPRSARRRSRTSGGWTEVRDREAGRAGSAPPAGRSGGASQRTERGWRRLAIERQRVTAVNARCSADRRRPGATRRDGNLR